jgi:aminopeptidase YwaD
VKPLLLLSLLLPTLLFAKTNREKKLLEQLKKDVSFLADDKLEGRRTGTIGEKIAASYIASRMRENKIDPFWNNSYLQDFEITEGNIRGEQEELRLFDEVIDPAQFGPLPCSANTTLSELIFNKMLEKGAANLVPISKVTSKNLANPHDEAMPIYEAFVDSLLRLNSKGVIFYNDINIDYDYKYVGTRKSQLKTDKAVIYINYDTYLKSIQPNLKKEWIDIACTIDCQPKTRTGINVAGFINNGAAKTVILGAHFDHLGYGEDHNSLHADTIKAIHNGADDNASGVGALLALGSILKSGKAKNNNYLLIAFSGEELGLFGSKKFIELNPDAIKDANYMINMDMLGRFDETKNALTIGGVGTSPTWIPTIENSKPFFKPIWDSAGVGPSDHTSFYLKDIPVLFFFTGLHTDYHKPTDDVDKINFNGEAKVVNYIASIIKTLDKSAPLMFTKTREPKMEGANFKVTLGIMPDYTFSGTGVRADGITPGKCGSRAGMKDGDIILQLGPHNTNDMQGYMEALSKFKKGQTTNLKVKRGNDVVEMSVTF